MNQPTPEALRVAESALSYKPGNLANRHLGPMVKEGTLERRFPEKPIHPEQACRSHPTPPPAIRANLEREAQP